MRKCPPLRILMWCALWVALAARADTPSPPAAFWEYMAEFEDQDGEVFDPIDLSEAEKVQQEKPASRDDTGQTAQSAQSESREEQQP